MVVLNGDLTSCEFVAPENVTALIDQVTAPLVDRNMPFAATFGNHDMSKTCSTRIMSEHMWDNVKGKDGKKLSLSTSSVSGPYEKIGTSNYYISLYSSSGGGNPHLSMMLWFFDSKGGHDLGKVDSNGSDVPVDNWVDDKVSSEPRMPPRWSFGRLQHPADKRAGHKLVHSHPRCRQPATRSCHPKSCIRAYPTSRHTRIPRHQAQCSD